MIKQRNIIPNLNSVNQVLLQHLFSKIDGIIYYLDPDQIHRTKIYGSYKSLIDKGWNSLDKGDTHWEHFISKEDQKLIRKQHKYLFAHLGQQKEMAYFAKDKEGKIFQVQDTFISIYDEEKQSNIIQGIIIPIKQIDEYQDQQLLHYAQDINMIFALEKASRQKNKLLETNIRRKNRQLAEFDAQLLKYAHDFHYIYKSDKSSQKEKLQISSKLKQKNRELTLFALFLQQKNEIVSYLANEIKYTLSFFEQDVKIKFSKIIKQMTEAGDSEKTWESFKSYFTNVYPDFYKRLMKVAPDLSSTERKICVYMKMDLNTKEIANLTYLSLRSVESHRYRIRKKIKLSSEKNLSQYLTSL